MENQRKINIEFEGNGIPTGWDNTLKGWIGETANERNLDTLLFDFEELYADDIVFIKNDDQWIATNIEGNEPFKITVNF